ncbi:hypothetical protein BV133_3128 [Blastochloris viridis]|uniref:Uncharacterized protein n=1 Tax=Blastochloris viridis TaxID=1079 RepID=A0A182D6Z5_BLAVI|nr:hypothetical protein BV133_3128 [Blastochloris viridis]
MTAEGDGAIAIQRGQAARRRTGCTEMFMPAAAAAVLRMPVLAVRRAGTKP